MTPMDFIDILRGVVINCFLSYSMAFVPPILLEIFLELSFYGQTDFGEYIPDVTFNYLKMAADVIESSLFLIIVFLVKRREIKTVSIPVLILILLPFIQMRYIRLIIGGGMPAMTSYMPLLLVIASSVAVIILFIAFNHYNDRLYEKEKTQIILQSMEDFDREYYLLVQKQIEEARFLRHDIINYLDQIDGFITSPDSSSGDKARAFIFELEERMSLG